jgi:O-antigen ligase
MLAVIAAVYYRGRLARLAPGLVVLGAAALLAHQGWLGQTAARLTQWSDPFGPRLYAWTHAWQMFVDAPVFGVGFDNFAATLVRQLSDTGRNWGVDQYAHNLFLQLAATCGAAGLLAVALPLGVAFHKGMRANGMRLAWCALAVLGLHSMLEQPLHYAYFLGLFALLAGALPQPALQVRASYAVRMLTALGALALLFFMGRTMREYDDLANTVYLDGSAPHYRNSMLFTPLRALAMPHTFVGADRPVQERLAFNAQVMHFAPVAEIMYRHVALTAEAGQFDQACQQLKRAARAYPGQLEIYAGRLQTLMQLQPEVFGGLSACGLTARP